MIVSHETPVGARITHHMDLMLWNCVAAYHDTYLDSLTSARPLYAVPDASLHTTEARQLCAFHAVAAAIPELMPQAQTAFKNGRGGQVAGLTDAQFTLPQEFHLSGGFDSYCAPTDATCIQNVLSCNGYRPAAVGAAVAQAMLHNGMTDGWNHKGQLTRDGHQCTANCRPYQDSSSYDTDKLSAPCVHDGTCWRELVEDNGIGFFFRQEHVCPHIGTHAQPRVLSRADVNSRIAPGTCVPFRQLINVVTIEVL